MLKKVVVFAIGIISFGHISMLSAQDKNPLTISGYLESYYTHDFNRPLNNTRPSFIYSHNRTNEANINLALLKTNYTTDKVRANFAIAVGTYMNANYAAEPGVLKNIYEANIGIKISKNHDLWIDAGILPSHIGFESAIGKDNKTLTRSLNADYNILPNLMWRTEVRDLSSEDAIFQERDGTSADNSFTITTALTFNF